MDGAVPADHLPADRLPADRLAGSGRTGPGTSDPISVTRIGTQVVVRVSGDVGGRHAERLSAAVEEVATLALRRVVVDLDDADELEGPGLEFMVDFLSALHGRWTLRLLNAPSGLRGRLPPARRVG